MGWSRILGQQDEQHPFDKIWNLITFDPIRSVGQIGVCIDTFLSTLYKLCMCIRLSILYNRKNTYTELVYGIYIRMLIYKYYMQCILYTV